MPPRDCARSNYAVAYALLARVLFGMAAHQISQPSKTLAEYAEPARIAIRLGPTDPETLCLAAFTIGFAGGDLDGGIAIIDRALSYNATWNEALQMGRSTSCLRR